MFGAAKRSLGVNHPIGAEQGTKPSRECLGRAQRGQRSGKSQFAARVEFAETGDKLAAEHSAEDLHREEEMRRRANPACVIRSQAAGRNDTVQMGVVEQLLVPGVEHAEETHLGAKVFGIAGNFRSVSALVCSKRSYTSLVLQGQRRSSWGSVKTTWT